MTKKDKEDERLERIIRGLLKLPENRRCLNCNSLGPQYVCTTFWTFVCTNCSGVHREFMHRVKSVSMAKFNEEEVSALQAGGNERARQIYFKDWDQHRHSFPDSSNINRLREFVKSIYVDRKYAGERSQERSSRIRLVSLQNDRQESFDARKLGVFRSGSECLNGKQERTLEYYFEERNSPRSVKESPRHGSLRRQTPRFEVVDDRFRDDERLSSRVFDISRLSHRESGQGSISSDPKSNAAQPELPAVRPLKQILGEKSVPLQVVEESKATGRKCVNVSGNEKPENSIIEFNTESKPAGGAATVQPENKKSSDGNIPSQQLTPSTPQRNIVEFLTFELAAPFVEPAGVQTKTTSADCEQPNGAQLSTPPGHMLALTYGFDASEEADRTDNPSGQQISTNPSATPVKNALLDSLDSPSSSSADNFLSETPEKHFQAAPLSGSGTTSEVSGGQPLDFFVAHRTSEGQHSATRFGTQEKQPSTSWNDHNVQGISSVQVGQSHQEDSKDAQEAAVKPQTETLGRKELPQDLFAGYLPASRSVVPGWPTGPYAAGFGVQYHPTAMLGVPYASQPRSSNPFDFNDETTPPQASQFPSMDSIHGALPDPMALGMAFPTTSSNFVSSGLMRPPQAASAMLPQSITYTSSFASGGGYTGQQPYVNMPHSRPQGPGGYSGDASSPSFNSFNLSHSGYSPKGPTNGGNPFG